MIEFTDNKDVKYEHIYLNNTDSDKYLKGWYFCDETEDLNGPFSTLEECEEIFKKYCAIYL